MGTDDLSSCIGSNLSIGRDGFGQAIKILAKDEEVFVPDDIVGQADTICALLDRYGLECNFRPFLPDGEYIEVMHGHYENGAWCLGDPDALLSLAPVLAKGSWIAFDCKDGLTLWRHWFYEDGKFRKQFLHYACNDFWA